MCGSRGWGGHGRHYCKTGLEYAGLEMLRPRPGSVSASSNPPKVAPGPREAAGHCPHLQGSWQGKQATPLRLPVKARWGGKGCFVRPTTCLPPLASETLLRSSPGQVTQNSPCYLPQHRFSSWFPGHSRHHRASLEGNCPQEGTVKTKDSPLQFVNKEIVGFKLLQGWIKEQAVWDQSLPFHEKN